MRCLVCCTVVALVFLFGCVNGARTNLTCCTEDAADCRSQESCTRKEQQCGRVVKGDKDRRTSILQGCVYTFGTDAEVDYTVSREGTLVEGRIRCNTSTCNKCVQPFENECKFNAAKNWQELSCACSVEGMSQPNMHIVRLYGSHFQPSSLCVEGRCSFQELDEKMRSVAENAEYERNNFQSLGHTCRLEYHRGTSSGVLYGCDFTVDDPLFAHGHLDESRRVHYVYERSWTVECTHDNECNLKSLFLNTELKAGKEKFLRCPTDISKLDSCSRSSALFSFSHFFYFLLFLTTSKYVLSL